MLNDITQWFATLWSNTFGALWNLLGDFILDAFSGFLTAVASLFAAIPVPSFLNTGLGTLFGGLTTGIIYVLVQVGFFQGIPIIGAAYGFRFIRKIVTLFQW